MTDTPKAAAPERTRKVYPLKDIGIAPENLRFDEAPDEEIPQLAATIKAAGLLQPLTVRPGRRGERPAMALDGRRRLLALDRLLAAGEIGEDYPVEVFEETDPARQAAAALLTNTAVPVHVADVIVFIGRMLKSKLTPTVIAQALGYAEVEVRRLAALSALPPQAIQALRAGRINLRQARMLARLKDASAQAELAQAALDGRGFADWRVSELLDQGAVT
ncbi:ParB/RepB/Spo0J family partition protein, partial [Phenylobacterium sp.]|uniref:ParB/RepB/Spo0J family partition protein n=1 Tax=Phenylobacterium sp. TaxID=1871053 RepID=UPI002E35F4BE